jgi:hypothetical protein
LVGTLSVDWTASSGTLSRCSAKSNPGARRKSPITRRKIFYSAFVDGKLDVPKGLLPEVHWLYFEPEYQDFSPQTIWSLSNAFTSAFKSSIRFDSSRQQLSWSEFLTNCLHDCKSDRRYELV